MKVVSEATRSSLTGHRQSLSQRSKTRTNVADPGSASGGTFQCMQFLPFFIYFSYLFYLGHLSLLGLQTKTRRQSNSSTLCSFKSHNPETFMSSTASASVHAICKRSQKCLAQKVGHLGSLGWIPMIQVPFNSSCVPRDFWFWAQLEGQRSHLTPSVRECLGLNPRSMNQWCLVLCLYWPTAWNSTNCCTCHRAS